MFVHQNMLIGRMHNAASVQHTRLPAGDQSKRYLYVTEICAISVEVSPRLTLLARWNDRGRWECGMDEIANERKR